MTEDREPILQFFAFDHLREDLRSVSAPFGLLARDLVDQLPRNPERTVALRKLLEAKDSTKPGARPSHRNACRCSAMPVLT